MAKILGFKEDYKGLNAAQAEENLAFYGYNSEIKHDEKHPSRMTGVFKSLRLYLMLGAAFLLYIGGDVRRGTLLLMLTALYCVVEILKETKCAEKLDGLSRAGDVTVRVVRDGEVVLMRRENIVQDDLIILQGGENVPADAHILESTDVTADESAFTGSNRPVKKSPGTDGKNELKQSCVYKGTRIVSGVLIARVFSIGQDVKIRPEVRSRKGTRLTEFETAVNRITRLLTYASAVILIIASALKFITVSPDPEEQNLLGFFAATFLPAVSFAMCALPAEISSIIRVYYITGALRLSRKYGGVKHLAALEKLNSVTAVLVGKDSVIESGNTTVVAEYSQNKEMLTRVSALACSPNPRDAYEKAIFLSAAFKHIDVRELRDNALLKVYDDDKRRINGCLWEIGGSNLLCVKGEPEVIISFCKPPSEQLFALQKKQQEYSGEGYRVIAFAFAKIPDGERNPETLFETEYTFLGLTAFSGSIRDNVPAAVKNCLRAGVKVIMLTPDGKETARAAAEKIGIKPVGVITGEELERERFGESGGNDLSGITVFAGISPSQKGDVTRLLRESGEIVAAFGSDSSDVEALEQADVGIALSKYTTERAWDVNGDTLSQSTTGSACEACDFIMEGDGFVKAADALREARVMHRNIKRCVSVACSCFAAIFLFALINLLSGSDFVTDAVTVSTLSVAVIPAAMLMFIDNKADMRGSLKPSEFIARGVINRNFPLCALIRGGSLFMVELIMFVASYRMPEGQKRAVFLAVFFSGLIAMCWVGLSFEKPFYRFFEKGNNTVVGISASLALFLLLITYLPFINASFGLNAIHPLMFFLCLIIGAASQLWFDFVKKRFAD